MSHTKPGASGKKAKAIPVPLVQFLVVDDHAFVRHIVTECLRSYKVSRMITAEHGDAALHILKMMAPSTRDGSLVELMSDRPDIVGDLYPESAAFNAAHAHCVITDFKMPNANGLEVLKAIRCGDTKIPRDTPVILLTGFSEDFVVSTALQLDVNAFVLKPVSRNTLWEKIQRVLEAVTPVQDIETYKSVNVPNDEGQFIEKEDSPHNPDILSEEAALLVREIPLEAIVPGTVLARDLHGAKGTLLLRAGTTFSTGILQKLRDLQSMKGLSGNIAVKTAPSDAPDSTGSAKL